MTGAGAVSGTVLHRPRSEGASGKKQEPQFNKSMKDSTHDKIEGTAKDAKGKVKEAAGKAVGNPNLRDEGRADQTEGKVQKKIGDVEKVFNR